MLIEKINTEIKSAMLARDKARLEPLRAIKSAILLAQSEKGAEKEMGEAKEIQMLQKLIKQRKESSDLYKEQDRAELAEVEDFQAKVIAEFLPEMISEEEIEKELKLIIEEVGASSQKDIGKIMPKAQAKFKGKADNKIIMQILRKILS